MANDAIPQRRCGGKRSLSPEQRDVLAELALDVDERLTAEDAANTRRRDAVDAAAREVVDSLARQDARTSHDAAVAALGRDATEQQINEWIGRYRPDDAGPTSGEGVTRGRRTT